MVSRQVQNVSRRAGPRASASPAIARWKAWLCRFAGAGSRIAARRPSGAAPGVTAAMRPASMSMRTSAAQPAGRSAVAAQIAAIPPSLDRSEYARTYWRYVQSFGKRMLLTHATAATPEGPLRDAAIVTEGTRIAWLGPTDALPDAFRRIEPDDLGGRLVTPGLIDCHTHIVHAGHRAGEFARRLGGESYADIARSGGGIAATVAATRAASEAELLAAALPRVDALIAEGVTTLEVKSGYGLDAETELRMLRVARRIGEVRPLGVRTSFLGAHAVPQGWRGDRSAWLDAVCLPALHAAADAGLADAVDAFCEGIAFAPAEIARVFAAATARGLPVKLHAEQLAHTGGAALAASVGALSADHLEHATAADAALLAAAGTVAVLLPGAYYTLGQGPMPPVAAFRAAGTAMAVATDCNPGSSPMASILLAMNMAATLFRLTPDEALAGVTRHAATALGLADRGRIAPGLRADLAVWDADDPAELSYRIGFNPLRRRIFGGAA